MTPECSSKGAAELVFDVAKPSGQIELLGLLDREGNPDNTLSGLFNWTCRACGAANRGTAAIQPHRACLTEWSCQGCSQTTLVQFRARAAADWIVQHRLAVAGKTLCDPVGRPPGSPTARYRRSNQRIFAWIAIPALALVIFLETAEALRLRSSSASPSGRWSESTHTSYVWLGGRWVSEDPSDMLFFGHMNPAAHAGAYTKISNDGKPADIVRFEIVHEEGTDHRLVLRELPPFPDRAPADSSGPGAILYISRQGDSMVRMTLNQGQPVMTFYHHLDAPLAP